jgi:hypothetical protein
VAQADTRHALPVPRLTAESKYEVTPKENANLLMREFRLGTLLASFERVEPTGEATALVFSAENLRLNNCSLTAPDPYLRIFKKLATGKDKLALPGGSWAPYRCPVYRTPPQHKTRAPSWGAGADQVIVPNELLTNTDGTPAELIVEAWDFQKRGKDRLIGRCLVRMDKVREEGATVPLQPAAIEDKQDFLDIYYMVAGLGLAKNAGSLTVTVSSAPAASPPVHHSFKRFDIDNQLRKLEGKGEPEPFVYQSLSARRRQVKAEMAAGEEVLAKGLLLGIKRAYREAKDAAWVAVGVGISRVINRYDFFYQTQMTMGAEFGSAMKALFVFMGSVVVQNLLLLLLWMPAWLPQSLYVCGPERPTRARPTPSPRPPPAP